MRTNLKLAELMLAYNSVIYIKQIAPENHSISPFSVEPIIVPRSLYAAPIRNAHIRLPPPPPPLPSPQDIFHTFLFFKYTQSTSRVPRPHVFVCAALRVCMYTYRFFIKLAISCLMWV